MTRSFVGILPVVLLLFVVHLVKAQSCTPDTSITNPGFYPTNGELPCVERGVPYSFDIQILNFTVFDGDAIGYPGVTANVNWVELESVTGLPNGLTYSCNPPDCRIPGGSFACINVSGTTTLRAQNYPINITARANVDVGGGNNLTLPFAASELGYYFSIDVINPAKPCPCPVPLVDFDHEVNEDTVTFYGNSPDADSLIWDFGDGSTAVGDTVTHIYELSQFNSVFIQVQGINFCGPDTSTGVVTLQTPNDTVVIVSVPALKLAAYPNPVNELLTVEHNATKGNVSIQALSGRVMFSQHLTDITPLQISTTEWPQGLYIVRWVVNDTVVNKKVLVMH